MSLISISTILDIFSDELSVFKKGENSLDSGHVLNVIYSRESNIIKGRVAASMKKNIYSVEICLTDAHAIDKYSCECARGLFKCHHVAAVLLFAHKNFSKTDSTCTWRAPAASTGASTTSVEAMYPPRKYRATKRDVTEEDKQNLLSELSQLNRFSGMYWLLQPEPQGKPEETKVFTNIIKISRDGVELKIETVLKNLEVSSEDIQRIAAISTGQRNNPTWHNLRMGRLTASNFGDVISAIERNKFPPSLFKKLLGKTSLEAVKSIQWGVNHEDVAIKSFEDLTSLKVVPTGLWLHPSGCIGGSPDGFVGDSAIIEVKCPFKFRNSPAADILNSKDYCFIDGMNLKSDHPYYHQIQGLLHITNRSLCYFVIWTPIETLILHFEKDANWIKNVPVLIDFYKINLLPKLLE